MASVFGERLKAAIAERGVNAAWVANKVGISTGNMSRYCTGYSDPDILCIIVRMARALNVSVDYLLGACDIMMPAPQTEKNVNEFETQYSHLFSNPDFQMYVGVYNNLTPKSRAFLTELVRSYGMNQNVVAEDGVTIMANPFNKQE